MGGGEQPLDHLPFFEVRLHNLLDILLIHVAVPDCLRVHHGHRSSGAAVQTARLVDADLARPGQPGRLDQPLAVVKRLLRLMLGTTALAIFSFVEAKKDVALVIRARRWVGGIGHGVILVFLLPPPDPGQHINERGIGPEPAQPLGDAIEPDKAPLLPGGQGLRKIGAGGRLVKQAQVHTQGQ